MKIKYLSRSTLLLVTFIITGATIAGAVPGESRACNECHAFPPTTINITTATTSFIVAQGQTFTVNISWSGGNPAGITEINWPTFFSNIGITRDNVLFKPTQRIPFSDFNTPAGTTSSNLTAPATPGNFIVRVYASRRLPVGYETDFKDINITVHAGPAAFDANRNNLIERDEAVTAVLQFFAGTVPRDIAVQAVVFFFSGTPITTNLAATLSGANEVPPTNSTATGSGTFVIDTAANTLSFNITFSGLLGTERDFPLGAHIHGPTAPGANAGILFPLPFGSQKVGVWNYTTEENETAIMSGLTYVNIHTDIFPDGEIRGQILPAI